MVVRYQQDIITPYHTLISRYPTTHTNTVGTGYRLYDKFQISRHCTLLSRQPTKQRNTKISRYPTTHTNTVGTRYRLYDKFQISLDTVRALLSRQSTTDRNILIHKVIQWGYRLYDKFQISRHCKTLLSRQPTKQRNIKISRQPTKQRNTKISRYPTTHTNTVGTRYRLYHTFLISIDTVHCYLDSQLNKEISRYLDIKLHTPIQQVLGIGFTIRSRYLQTVCIAIQIAN